MKKVLASFLVLTFAFANAALAMDNGAASGTAAGTTTGTTTGTTMMEKKTDTKMMEKKTEVKMMKIEAPVVEPGNYTATAALNIRSEGSMISKAGKNTRIGGLKRGDVVTVTGQSANKFWCMISAPKTGVVACSHLKKQ